MKVVRFLLNSKNYRKSLGFLMAFMTFSASVTGCAESGKTDSFSEKITDSSVVTEVENTEAEQIETKTEKNEKTAVSELFSKRDLNPEYDSVKAEITLNGTTAEIDGTGVKAEGSVVTITEEGVYRVSGKLDDGQIIIDAEKTKVQIVLDNADITCKSSSPLYAKNCDKLFVTLADGSENKLSDGDEYSFDEGADEPDACLFSKNSLTVNGEGKLDINAEFSDGIRSKDDVVITGGTLNITSVGDGIKGKDYVAVADGIVNIKSESDGIKSTNSEDETLGFIYAEGGKITIESANDCIQAETELNITGGEFDLKAGGGSLNATKVHTDDFGGGMRGGFGGGFRDGGMTPPDRNDGDMPDFFGGFGEMMPPDRFGNEMGEPPENQWGASNVSFVQIANTSDAEEDSDGKGLKAGTLLNIEGGTIKIDSSDDAVHSNDKIAISGGEITLDAGDDGIHADSQIDITGGKTRITKSYEGIESAVINISGGVTEVKSSDDGINASDGNTSQGGMGTYTEGVIFKMTKGTLYVDADGDGLDSNGDMVIEDGLVVVNGPVNSGNGALDSNNDIFINGGLVIAAGSSGMAEGPSEKSLQNSVSVTFENQQEGGTLVTLTDNDGNEILSFAPTKTFDNIVISSPKIIGNETYRIYTGGTSSAESEYGLYKNGGYNADGNEEASFTAENAHSYVGNRGMNGGGMMGGHGGRGDFGRMPPVN